MPIEAPNADHVKEIADGFGIALADVAVAAFA